MRTRGSRPRSQDEKQVGKRLAQDGADVEELVVRGGAQQDDGGKKAHEVAPGLYPGAVVEDQHLAGHRHGHKENPVQQAVGVPREIGPAIVQPGARENDDAEAQPEAKGQPAAHSRGEVRQRRGMVISVEGGRSSRIDPARIKAATQAQVRERDQSR